MALLENVSVNVMVEDKRIWKLKSFFDKLIDDQVLLNFQPAHMIWKAKVPSKVQIFAWSFAFGKLSNGNIIQRRNPNVCLSPCWCVMCKRNGKSTDHLFLYYHNAVQLWSR